jgi:uncharacterized protein
MSNELKLKLLDDTFAIHRFSPSHGIPDAVFREAFFGVVKTDEELSIVCRESLGLDSAQCHRGWSCMKVSGPLDLMAVGILANLSKVLADARICVFVISTYDTDYILIPAEKSAAAVAALEGANFQFT